MTPNEKLKTGSIVRYIIKYEVSVGSIPNTQTFIRFLQHSSYFGAYNAVHLPLSNFAKKQPVQSKFRKRT